MASDGYRFRARRADREAEETVALKTEHAADGEALPDGAARETQIGDSEDLEHRETGRRRFS